VPSCLPLSAAAVWQEGVFKGAWLASENANKIGASANERNEFHRQAAFLFLFYFANPPIFTTTGSGQT
jgi:hypothetical protein